MLNKTPINSLKNSCCAFFYFLLSQSTVWQLNAIFLLWNRNFAYGSSTHFFQWTQHTPASWCWYKWNSNGSEWDDWMSFFFFLNFHLLLVSAHLLSSFILILYEANCFEHRIFMWVYALRVYGVHVRRWWDEFCDFFFFTRYIYDKCSARNHLIKCWFFDKQLGPQSGAYFKLFSVFFFVCAEFLSKLLSLHSEIVVTLWLWWLIWIRWLFSLTSFCILFWSKSEKKRPIRVVWIQTSNQ